MGALSDISVGTKAETTYGTGVTVDRFFQPNGGVKMEYDKGVVQGEGLRVGSRVARVARRVVTTKGASVEFEVDCESKGQGTLWRDCMGVSESTVVSGSTYQQRHRLGTTSDTVAPIFTLQSCAVRDDGTVDPYTFTGCVVTDWELSAAQGEIVKLKVNVDARNVTTATAYATPSYSTSPSTFHFAQGTVTAGTGITVTDPTTTALGSFASGTAIANITDFTLQVDHKRKTDRRVFGNAGLKSRPTNGLPEIKGKITIEYTDRNAVDAFLADTTASILLTFDTGVALSTGNETLQVTIPACKLDGALPEPNGELVTVDLDFMVLDDLSHAPLSIVQRTADTAL